MTIGSKNNKKSSTNVLVRAYASLLQQHLDVIVTPCDLYYAGRGVEPVTSEPSSLVTIEPYVPGGVRRLVLNANHPLVLEVARHAASCGSNKYDDDEALNCCKEFGAALLWTASWPTDIDLGAAGNNSFRHSLNWNSPQGIISGPHVNMICPIPHLPIRNETWDGRSNNNSNCNLTALAVWPKRLHSIIFVVDKEKPADNFSEKKVNTMGGSWARRDVLLQQEWNALLQCCRKWNNIAKPTFSKIFGCFSWSDDLIVAKGLNKSSSLLESKQLSTSTKHETISQSCNNEWKLAVLSPGLPVLVLAQYLQRPPDQDTSHNRYLRSSRATSLSTASSVLLSCDRLFGLSVFFGVPLLDRTETLRGALKVERMVRPVPTKDQVQDYIKTLKANGIHEDAHKALNKTMIERARHLWQRLGRNKQSIIVCWSGGIDSTAVLVAFLQTQKETNGDSRNLCVVLNEDSIVENPTFYKDWIESSSTITVIQRNGRTLGELAKVYQREGILVTGELGDQLFGSNKCMIAFSNSKPKPIPLTPDEKRVLEAKYLLQDGNAMVDEIKVSLSEKWEDSLLPLLDDYGLLGNGGAEAWKAWIAPQLAKAPFPIVNLYDMLWWINFSCKWQSVALRCLHDGGAYYGSDFAWDDFDAMTGAIVHFYNDHALECWACVSGFHKKKFQDLHSWSTYKEPLKQFIHSFDSNDKYYNMKTKVGSLSESLKKEKRDVVNATAGFVISTNKHNTCRKFERLSWGAACMRECHSEDLKILRDENATSTPRLETLLEPWILEETSSTPPMCSKVVHDNPWTHRSYSNRPSPFSAAPQFADVDERQRRHRNPVTAITLEGKCSALLPPASVKGKSVLDLGAYLGAMCHWSLYYGARYVVGVEPQGEFCDRMKALLRGAGHTWPQAEDTGGNGGSACEPFEVVQSGAVEYLAQCENLSFDIVVAAGVLHCFEHPMDVILDMARVAKEAVVIESVHPDFHRAGYVAGPMEWSSGTFCSALKSALPVNGTNLLESTPSAAVNKAGDVASFIGFSLVPSEQLIKNTMTSVGFEVASVQMAQHPTSDEQVLTYTACRRLHASPVRFLLRCIRHSQSVLTLRSLEKTVIDGVGAESKWNARNPPNWTGYRSPDLHSKEDLGRQNRSETARGDNSNNNTSFIIGSSTESLDCEKGTWKFDVEVSKRFEDEARRHIPDYFDVVQTCIDTVLTMFGKDAIADLLVVEVGCATGYTILELLRNGFRNIICYDILQSMIEQAVKHLGDETNQTVNSAGTSDIFTVFLAESSFSIPTIVHPNKEYGAKPIQDVIFANWTVQFIVDQEKRKLYIRQLFAALKPGGILLLTEKTTQDTATKAMYYKWKASPPQNVSWDEILRKEAKLKGVLETQSIEWYLSVLTECGFGSVSILRAKYGFVTFLCRKEESTNVDVSTSPNARGKSIPPPHHPFTVWNDVESLAHNVSFDASCDPEPYRFAAWGHASTRTEFTCSNDEDCCFGYVYSGQAELHRECKLACSSSREAARFILLEGMYFSCPGKFRIQGGCGFIAIAPGPSCRSGQVKQKACMFSIGGPVEVDDEGEMLGRLPYIDGCTDSLLIPPVFRGAPCLNHLHFPSNVKQTQHTHPSGRIGMVIRGNGHCVLPDTCVGGSTTPSCDDSTDLGNVSIKKTPLRPGMAFVIPANAPHAFETSNDCTLDVIAFHPDSDFGPTATNHPMVNRTIVEGVSASLISSIQTNSTI